MILQRLECTVEDLLGSDQAVAICQLEGEKLKEMILTVRSAGWGSVLVETPANEHFLVFAVSPAHQGNLVGDIRRWTRQYGYQFFLKLSGDRFSTPRPNVFVLADGREIEVRSLFTRAGNFTHWGLTGHEVMPAGYERW